MNNTTHGTQHAARTPALAPKRGASASVVHHVEWIAFVAIMLLAAFLRFYALDTIPPGMQSDEVVNVGVIRAIAAGWRPVFIPQGWGREPLYHYLATLLFAFIGHPQIAIRITVAFIGLALIPTIGILASRLANQWVRLLAMAFTAITYWAVFASRYGVRGILLPLMSTLTFIVFWRALQSNRGTARGALRAKSQVSNTCTARRRRCLKFVLAGVLLGLTFYTYQSSRVFPAMFVAIGLWLWLFDRQHFFAAWRGILLFLVVGLIVGAPMFTYLLTHPGSESGRAFMLEPLVGLRDGDLGPLEASLRASLGAFSFDAGGWHYNVPGHPIFPLVTGALFYLGVLTCLIRWRDLRRFALLTWLLVGLLPSMVTSGTHYYRMIGALVPAMILPAIGLVDTADWLARRFARRKTVGAVILLIVGALALGQSAATTWRDYFQIWAVSPTVRDYNEADLREIGRYLDRSADTTPVVIASLAAEDVDPDQFGGMIERADIEQHWFDASTALVFPGGTQTARYIFRPETPLRGVLNDYFAGAQLILDQHWYDGLPSFKVYQLDVTRAREAAEARAAWPLGKISATSIRFGDKAELLGYTVPLTITPGNPLRLLTTWRIVNPATPGPSGIFAHLLDADSHIVAQDDHLGFPRHSWHVGDVFVQFSRLEIPSEIATGRYTLQVGFYDKDTQVRWPVTDATGKALGDHLVLGQLVVRDR
jgi:4-amino-4-deoxy-L-arabinose transferase-like glycosyltransferase